MCDAARAFGAPAVLKWPNDVLVGDKKLAGVLVETQSQGGQLDSVIVGIGVNLEQRARAPSRHRAIALGTSIAKRSSRELLAQLERWVDRYVACGVESIVPAWHAAHGARACRRAP